MAYWDISSLQADNDFALRTTAAYAVESLSTEGHLDPPNWQAAHSWDMAAQPGFGDAYASALAGNVERPGRDPSVITDGQIGAAVQSLSSTFKEES